MSFTTLTNFVLMAAVILFGLLIFITAILFLYFNSKPSSPDDIARAKAHQAGLEKYSIGYGGMLSYVSAFMDGVYRRHFSREPGYAVHVTLALGVSISITLLFVIVVFGLIVIFPRP